MSANRCYCEHRIGEFCNTIYKPNDVFLYPKVLLDKNFKFYAFCPFCGFKIDKSIYISNAKVYLKSKEKVGDING